MPWGSRRPARLNLQKSSVKRLEEALAAAKAKREQAAAEKAHYERDLTAMAGGIVEARDLLSRIDSRIHQIQQGGSNWAAFFRGVWLGDRLTPPARARMIQLQASRVEVARKLATFEHLQEKQSRADWTVNAEGRLCQELEEAIEARHRKREKLDQLRAAAARSTAESRMVAESVKTQLRKASCCPYCGRAIGPTPHCDHIYPIAKGGRSTRRNMVWVCSGCNTKKGELTLAGFIRQFSLDRHAIESRLASLGKDF